MLAALIRRMCVKERDRRIADPSSLMREFARLGYQLTRPASAQLQYVRSVETAPTVRSVKEVLDKLPTKGSETLSFETDDVEIRAFVSGLKRRRLARKAMTAALVAATALAAAFIAIAFLR